MTLIKKKIKKKEASDSLFTFAIVILIGFYILRASFFASYFEPHTRLFLFVCLFILALRELVFCRKSSWKYIFGFGLVLLLVVACFFTLGGYQIAVNIIFLYSARNVDLKKILKTCLITTIITTFFIVLCSQIGVIEDRIVQQGDRERHFMGFLYALYLPAFLFNATAVFVYLKRNTIKLFHGIIIVLLDIYVYQMTVSRLSAFATIAVVVMGLLYSKKEPVKAHKYSKVFVWIFPVMALCSVAFFTQFDPNVVWMENLDEILGHRATITQRSLNLYAFNLIGNRSLIWVGQGLSSTGEQLQGEITFVDNVYIHILQRFGIVFLAIVLFACVLGMKNAYAKKDYYLYTIFIIMSIYGLIQDFFYQVQYNAFLFAIITLIFNKNDPLLGNVHLNPKQRLQYEIIRRRSKKSSNYIDFRVYGPRFSDSVRTIVKDVC